METPDLLMLHGFTGDPSNWDPVLRHLPGTGRVAAPALVGHAPELVRAAVNGFEGEVDRIVAELPATRRFHLCGYSLGARLGLGLLLRHPERLRGATLLGLNPGIADAEERRARLEADEAWVRLLEDQGVDAFVEQWERLPLFATQRDLGAELQTEQRARRRAHSASGLAHSLRTTGLARMPNYWERLNEPEVPVTLVAGEHDPKFSSMARRAASHMRSARVVILPRVGHNAVLEDPASVARVIAEDMGLQGPTNPQVTEKPRHLGGQ